MRKTALWLLLLLLVACTPKQKFADQIPIYPGAEFSNYLNENPGGGAKSTSWFYKTPDAAEKVVEFYQGKLETADKSEEDDSVVFEWQPAGAGPIKGDKREGIRIEITHEDGTTTIRITETLKA